MNKQIKQLAEQAGYNPAWSTKADREEYSYLPQAIADGHGVSWALMCREQTTEAAWAAARTAACWTAAAAAAEEAAAAAYADTRAAAAADCWAQRAIDHIKAITKLEAT